jgi:hypothetical protein
LGDHYLALRAPLMFGKNPVHSPPPMAGSLYFPLNNSVRMCAVDQLTHADSDVVSRNGLLR